MQSFFSQGTCRLREVNSLPLGHTAIWTHSGCWTGLLAKLGLESINPSLHSNSWGWKQGQRPLRVQTRNSQVLHWDDLGGTPKGKAREDWTLTLILPLTSCLTLGKPLTSSEISFFTSLKWKNPMYTAGLLWGLKVKYKEWLIQCLEHSGYSIHCDGPN